MTRTLVLLLYGGLGLASCGAAVAQNPQPAAPGVHPAPVAPPSAPSPPPERIAPHAGPGQSGNHTLSDKLSQRQGTLRPPTGVDPGMTVAPPPHAQGTMPVITPPGSPGGNQKMVPK